MYSYKYLDIGYQYSHREYHISVFNFQMRMVNIRFVCTPNNDGMWRNLYLIGAKPRDASSSLFNYFVANFVFA